MRRRKKKYRINVWRLIFVIFFIGVFTFIGVSAYRHVTFAFDILKDYQEDMNDNGPTWESESAKVKNRGRFETVAIVVNEDYEGPGQEEVSDSDEYFTTFTTLEGRTYREYKQNGIAPWAENEYWDGEMKKTGCGITALSIILSGYDAEYTPEDLRNMYVPYMDYTYMHEELSDTFGIDASYFLYDYDSKSAESIITHLQSGSPILVCVWNEPEKNRWTTESHYMVLLAADDKDMVYVSNPNGLMNRHNSSGWYHIDEITPYIAKVMYIY